MSTPEAKPVPTGVSAQQEIRVYSHSTLYYWWPVWAVGFFMFLWTFFIDGGHMAFVPKDTRAYRNATVQVGKDALNNRDVLVAPEGKSLPPHRSAKPGEPLPQPTEEFLRVAESKNPGVLFAITLILIILISNVAVRGVWSIITIVLIVLISVVFALLDIWGTIFAWFTLLRIHINAGGYLFIAITLFIIWAVVFFIFDRRTYIIFTPGQVRICQMVGEGEKVYDAAGTVFQKQQNDFFRHWVVGLGAGDLTVKTGGSHAETFEWHNVVFVSSKIRRIEEMLKSREVV